VIIYQQISNLQHVQNEESYTEPAPYENGLPSKYNLDYETSF